MGGRLGEAGDLSLNPSSRLVISQMSRTPASVGSLENMMTGESGSNKCLEGLTRVRVLSSDLTQTSCAPLGKGPNLSEPTLLVQNGDMTTPKGA